MKVTLIGSTQYMEQFHEANMELTLKGYVVYSVATSVHGDFNPTPQEKLVLDMVHLRKISESEIVVVVGQRLDGSYYIGESTRRELMFANVLGKNVVFYSKGKETVGPTSNFEEDLERASMTMKDQEKKERELRVFFGETAGEA